MNILEICLGEGLGGLELYFRNCCTHLAKADKVVSVTYKGSRLDQIANREDQYHYSLSSKSKIFSLAAIRQLLGIIKKENIEVVHIHHKEDLAIIAWVKLLSKANIKIVHTRQMQLPGSKKDPYHRFVYGSIDLYIAISDGLKAEAQKKIPIPKDRIIRLYYGVEKANKNDIDTSFLQKRDKFNIGVFSRIEYQKGQHLVIEACNKMLELSHEIEVYFVGDTMDREYGDKLKAMIPERFSERYHFTGFHKKPTTIMPLFDLIIMPSKNETFGLVLVEAMRAGVSVIGTNAGGVPEIIDHGETGLLFPWGDAEALAEHIKKNIEDTPFRKLMAINGQMKADENFEINKHFERLKEILSKLTSSELRA